MFLCYVQNKPQATSHKPQAFKLGFTLSELLVSLAVLGLIAGLTVPSIVVSVEKAKTKALLKESLQAISQIVQAGVLNGDFDNMTNFDVTSPTSPFVDYFTTKLNAKNCPKDTLTPPCDISLENLSPSSGYSNHSARWILSNGVQIFRRGDWTVFGSHISFSIDVKPNGTNSKFGVGGDQLWVICNIGSTPLPLDLGGLPMPLSIKSTQCASPYYWNHNLLFDSLMS